MRQSTEDHIAKTFPVKAAADTSRASPPRRTQTGRGLFLRVLVAYYPKVRRYKVTAFYPSFPGLHPLDDTPHHASVVVEADDERHAALTAVRDAQLPVARAQRQSGGIIPIYWHPGLYGSEQEPKIVESSPSEVVIGFGDEPKVRKLTLSICPVDEFGEAQLF